MWVFENVTYLFFAISMLGVIRSIMSISHSSEDVQSVASGNSAIDLSERLVMTSYFYLTKLRLCRNHAFDRFSQSFLEAYNTMDIEGIQVC
jgi:hypothetical protein